MQLQIVFVVKFSQTCLLCQSYTNEVKKIIIITSFTRYNNYAKYSRLKIIARRYPKSAKLY